MLLSPHFTFDELTITTHRSLLEENRERARGAEYALTTLCTTLLEPIRLHFGKPIIIHSGFRCIKLNTAIGGAKQSQHLVGEAADFHVLGVGLEETFEAIRKLPLQWGQLILEGAGHTPAWIHLSLGAPFRTNKLQQVLRIDTATGKVIKLS